MCRSGPALLKPGQLPMLAALRYLGPGAAILAECTEISFKFHFKHLLPASCFLLCRQT